MWSGLCNSFEDRAPVDFIYGCPNFKMCCSDLIWLIGEKDGIHGNGGQDECAIMFTDPYWLPYSTFARVTHSDDRTEYFHYPNLKPHRQVLKLINQLQKYILYYSVGFMSASACVWMSMYMCVLKNTYFTSFVEIFCPWSVKKFQRDNTAILFFLRPTRCFVRSQLARINNSQITLVFNQMSK